MALWLTQGQSFGSHFARLGAAGETLVETVIVPGPERTLDASLAWTGDGFGLVWSDDRTGTLEIYFTELDSAGNPRAPDARISSTAGVEASQPAICWAGDGYGLAWLEYVSDNHSRVHFKRIDRSGAALSPELEWQGVLIGAVWTGTEFAVAFQSALDESRSLSLVRFDAAGVRTKEHVVTADWTDWVWTALAWSGDRLALASAETDITFYLARCP